MHRILIICTILTACLVALSAAEHGHDHAGGHGDEGPAQALGELTLGDLTLTASLHGAVSPGGEAVVSLATTAGEAPSELRSWIGVANGRGSVKALLQADAHGHFHGHLEVPDSLPEGSALWVGVVTDAGRQRASVPLPAAGHEHGSDAHAGHDHGSDAHAGHDHGSDAHAGHDHGSDAHAGHDHGSDAHAGHDHGDHEH